MVLLVVLIVFIGFIFELKFATKNSSASATTLWISDMNISKSVAVPPEAVGPTYQHYISDRGLRSFQIGPSEYDFGKAVEDSLIRARHLLPGSLSRALYNQISSTLV